ncbi:MAG: phosphotransferase [Phycisphaeraceae bacterium]|nr:phosphotransferase [Phycisphaeraceae bacterium]
MSTAPQPKKSKTSKPPKVVSAKSKRGAPGGSGIDSKGRGGGRERFGTYELTKVLSHYDVGVIEGIQEFPRGSRKSPKLILKSDTGFYLLKRRPQGKDSPYKVAFCHNIQLYLARKQFPLPQLIGTRRENNSMLQLDDEIYELFEYIKGTSYDSSLEATHDSGRILALFHKLLADHEPENYDPPTVSYHDNKSVRIAMEKLPETLEKRTSPDADTLAEINQVNDQLSEFYEQCYQEIEDAGLSEWPVQIVHGDWHPGNMLYRGSRVVGVIDYDTARIYQRIIDVANGALQFSIVGGSEDPSTWPARFDEPRLKRFLQGYDSVPNCVLSRAELEVSPPLMIEALIAEAVIPIANTGQFATIDGFAFMKMMVRKIQWLRENAEKISNILESDSK